MMNNYKKKYPLEQSPLYKLSSKIKLANLLYISCSKLKFISKSENLYNEWQQKRENKAPRVIEEPKLPLKQIQERIANLLSRIETPEFLFCPAKGKSYISNAKAHINNLVVHTLDIKKFFSSTSSKRVYWFFHKKMQCSSDIAGILTQLSTYKGHLPTGSPLSPLMSYYAHIDMWEEISKIAIKAQCTLTVYMDDLTISGSKIPSTTLWQIKQQIHRFGLRYHKEKHYASKIRKVTGVIIKNDTLNLPNRQHLKLYKLNRQIQTTSDSNIRNELILQAKGLKAQALQIQQSNNDIEV